MRILEICPAVPLPQRASVVLHLSVTTPLKTLFLACFGSIMPVTLPQESLPQGPWAIRDRRMFRGSGVRASASADLRVSAAARRAAAAYGDGCE